ncbi:hypothetical protein [Pseudomonas sp. TWP3-2]|uniref:hypothetical protein n=1 Tax=Pseudomonas sp. TWP3-2 TaxID=2804574 RepID=UPI003CEF3F87
MKGINSSNEHLDKTFGNDGVSWIEHTDVARGFMQRLTVGPDQKLIIAGASGSNFYVGRLNEDGTTDSSFNDYGYRTGKFREGYQSTRGSISVLKSGEILLSGAWSEHELGPTKRGLALFDHSGRPVTTFGEAGTTVVHPDSLPTQALAQQTDQSKESPAGQQNMSSIELPDGKLMVRSNHQYSYSDNIGILMRVDRQGKIDYTFGNQEGYVRIQYTAHSTYAGTVIPLSNGNFAIGGIVHQDRKNLGFIALYNSAGDPVETFGVGGYVLLDSIGALDQIFSLLETSDGNIIGIGSTDKGELHGLIVCLDKTGGFVQDFNGGKPVITPAPDPSTGLQWLSGAQRADGKFVTLGSTTGASSAIIINQYHSNGGPDENFGTSGQVIVKVSDVLDIGQSVAIQQDKIVGVATSLPQPEGVRAYAFRLKS